MSIKGLPVGICRPVELPYKAEVCLEAGRCSNWSPGVDFSDWSLGMHVSDWSLGVDISDQSLYYHCLLCGTSWEEALVAQRACIQWRLPNIWMKNEKNIGIVVVTK